MSKTPKGKQTPQKRYGIGEWYGHLFTEMSCEERRHLAELALASGTKMPCPWRSTADSTYLCNKKGGVCTLRLYVRDTQNGLVAPAQGSEGELCTMCPNRFYEGDKVFGWIGGEVFGHDRPLVLSEIGFLERGDGEEAKSDVGKIDHVLVHPDTVMGRAKPAT